MLDESHTKMKATSVFPVFYVLHSLVIATFDWEVKGAAELPKLRNNLQGKELKIVAGNVK